MLSARQTLQTLVTETLADPGSAFGYALSAISFGEAVEISFEKDGATFTLWLRPVSDETRCYRKTPRFKIGHDRDPPDRLGYNLIDAVCVRIEIWEQSLPDDAYAQLFAPQSVSRGGSVSPCERLPFVEWSAVRSGLKPACRSVVRAEIADRLIEEARATGLRIGTSEAGAFISGFCTDQAGEDTLVYVGRTEEAVTAVAVAERSMMEAYSRGQRVTADQVRALGAALGYPLCCIEAFIPIRDLSNAEIRFHALQRTSGPASFLLNDTVREGVLVSHSVCRYDCPDSIRYARALFLELTRGDPTKADEMQRALRGWVIVFARGGALRLVPSAVATHQFAAVEAAGEGELLERWHTILRRADGLDQLGDEVRILRGNDEIGRLSAPPDEIQIRLFE